jgi:drug/metabolite transporter (DMT)-like permease
LKRYLALFLIVLSALMGSGVPVFAKIALEVISPLLFTLIRFTLAFIVLLPFFLNGREQYKIRDFRKLFFVSVIGALNVTLFVFGIRWTTASTSQMLYTFAPLLAGIISYYLLKERLGARKIIGILIGFLGSLIIILLPMINTHSSLNRGLVGNLIIFGAVCSFALYSVLTKKYQRDFSPLAITMSFVITTIIIQLVLLPFVIGQNLIWLNGQISSMTIIGTLYVGILGTGGFYLIYQYAIKTATPVIASTVQYLQPLFTIVWAVSLLHEKITSGFILGGVLALTGVALVTIKTNGRQNGKITT